ncbi:MAG TPA: hypothetical protein VGL74_05340 [Terriglobales bacterium]|jgi:hypothetical protein
MRRILLTAFLALFTTSIAHTQQKLSVHLEEAAAGVEKEVKT